MNAQGNAINQSPFSLVSPDDAGSVFASLKRFSERLLGLDQLHQVYEEIQSLQQIEVEKQFHTLSLKALALDFEISAQDIAAIPKEGPLVVVSNHPFGGPEGLVLAELVSRVRPDVKVMTNHLLRRIPEFDGLFIGVDLFDGDGGSTKNVKPLRETLQWLKAGHVIVVFPAGEVSRLELTSGKISDRPWSSTIGRLIKATKSTVLPLFIHGRNGILFQCAGLAHPLLRTALLPRELLKKRHTTLQLSAGQPIAYKKLEAFPSDETVMQYLRFRTYALAYRKGNTPPTKPLLSLPKMLSGRVEQPIESRRSKASFMAEIEKLKATNMVTETREAWVFFARAEQIPNVLHEIGRLREITFRAVEEGTGKSLDLDEYDQYYMHLFAWHKTDNELIGAYRFGLTDEILADHGVQGLYTTDLFSFRRSLFEKLGPSLEMGRSFIQKNYQRSPYALALLWKGIGSFVAKHPKYRFLFGPVSISNAYAPLARQLIIEYLKFRHGMDVRRVCKRPKKKVKTGIARKLKCREFLPFMESVQDLSPMIADLHDDELGSVPILLKQYIKLGARVAAFNLDKDFNNSVDCLVFLDLVESNHKQVEGYMGKEGFAQFIDFHRQLEEKPKLDIHAPRSKGRFSRVA